MIAASFQTPEDIQASLGERLRELRLGQPLSQAELADRAGVSTRTIGTLEAGEGSSLITLIRVLKALDALSSLDAIAPRPSVSPMSMLRTGDKPRRVSRRSR